MPELTPRERLQPSLLDRLTDEEPDKQQESREKRVLSMFQLRRGVLRDLAWLLNTGNLATAQDLEPFPLVARSVLNYGIADLTGASVSGMSRSALEAMMRQAIIDFEPRILADTVRVSALVSEEAMNRNAVAFQIEGELWGQPVSTRLFLRTEIDLDTGHVSLTESAGATA